MSLTPVPTPFVAAGASAAQGLVPKPGASANTPPYYLGDDAAFHAPLGVAGLASAVNFKAANNAGTPNTKINLLVGPYWSSFSAVLEDTSSPPATYKAISSATITIDAGTTGANGLDTGVQALSTWYYFYLIYNGTTVAGLLSTSKTAPTMPSGYTYEALMGAVYSNASTHFNVFVQFGKIVNTPTTNIFTNQAGVTSFTSQSLTTTVPPIASVCLGTIGTGSGVGSGWRGMSVSADSSGSGEQIVGAYGTATFEGYTAASPFRIAMATAQTVYKKMFDTLALYNMDVSGWEYP